MLNGVQGGSISSERREGRIGWGDALERSMRGAGVNREDASEGDGGLW